MENELFFGLMFILATALMLKKRRAKGWRTKADATAVPPVPCS